MHASKLKEIVDQYMESNQRISRLCKSIAEILLVQIDSKSTATPSEMESKHEDYRVGAESQLQEHHLGIIAVLKRMFEVFKNDGQDVLQHWRKYTVNIDKMVEDALRLNVKKSLQVGKSS